MKQVTKQEFFEKVALGNVHPSLEVVGNNKVTGKSFWKRLDKNNELVGVSVDIGHGNEADYFLC